MTVSSNYNITTCINIINKTYLQVFCCVSLPVDRDWGLGSWRDLIYPIDAPTPDIVPSQGALYYGYNQLFAYVCNADLIRGKNSQQGFVWHACFYVVLIRDLHVATNTYLHMANNGMLTFEAIDHFLWHRAQMWGLDGHGPLWHPANSYVIILQTFVLQHIVFPLGFFFFGGG